MFESSSCSASLLTLHMVSPFNFSHSNRCVNTAHVVLMCISLISFLIICGCSGSLVLHPGFLQLWCSGACCGACGLLIAVASFVAEYRLQGLWSSVIVAHRLSRSDHWTTKEVLHLLDNY